MWFTDGKNKFLIGDPAEYHGNLNLYEDGFCEVEELTPGSPRYKSITQECRALIKAAITEWVKEQGL
jgi:hypothetical protein